MNKLFIHLVPTDLSTTYIPRYLPRYPVGKVSNPRHFSTTDWMGVGLALLACLVRTSIRSSPFCNRHQPASCKRSLPRPNNQEEKRYVKSPHYSHLATGCG